MAVFFVSDSCAVKLWTFLTLRSSFCFMALRYATLELSGLSFSVRRGNGIHTNSKISYEQGVGITSLFSLTPELSSHSLLILCNWSQEV